MRKLYYLVMISLASILTACENRSEEWDVVDFGNDCTVGLQEHLECRFIPLETKDSVLLKDLYRVCWVDDRIFVFDRSDEINALFVFSDQGNFITRVGLRGQGPEEYLYLTHFFVDEKERILTLVDFGGTYLPADFFPCTDDFMAGSRSADQLYGCGNYCYSVGIDEDGSTW